MTLLLALFLAFGDIAAVKSEADPEKRSELALANAEHSMDEARKAYAAGDQQSTQVALNELAESVGVCYEALQHARTQPRKSKYYKHAEQRVSLLMRRLAGLRDDVNFDSRASVETALKKVSDVHDQLIADIMSKKK